MTLVLQVGGMSGFLSGMFGIGGGTLTVPAIALTTDLNHHEVLGTFVQLRLLGVLLLTLDTSHRWLISDRPVSGPAFEPGHLIRRLCTPSVAQARHCWQCWHRLSLQASPTRWRASYRL